MALALRSGWGLSEVCVPLHQAQLTQETDQRHKPHASGAVLLCQEHEFSAPVEFQVSHEAHGGLSTARILCLRSLSRISVRRVWQSRNPELRDSRNLDKVTQQVSRSPRK